MSRPSIPRLRKVTKNPLTGKLHHRRVNGHNQNTNITPVPLFSNPTDTRLIRDRKTASMAMPTAETQTDAPQAHRDEELHMKLDKLTERFSGIDKACADYRESLEFTQAEVKELKEENAVLKDNLYDLSIEMQRNTYAIQKLTTKQGNLETSTRKRNLVLEGVPEHQQQQGGRENLHEVICSLFSEMGIAKPIDYDLAFRIGNRPGRAPRPILISFIRLDDRNLIYTNRSQLRKSRSFQKVWVSEDVTPQTRRSRNVIREVAKEARNQGVRCQATPGSVTINNRRYTEANLDDLPQEYAVEKIKMKKLGDTIAYNSEHAPFSNLYPTAVPLGKHVYLCSEQAFRHTRAEENNHHNVAARILWSRDPYEMMELDKDLPVSEEWKQKEDFTLFKCMFRKYEVNEELRDTLISTADLELAEATRSTKWATGASLNSTAMKTHAWTGENRQGKHTMKIRNYFIKYCCNYGPGETLTKVEDEVLRELYNSE